MVLEQTNCQKQLLADVLQNRRFLKFRNMHSKEKIIKRLLYGWFPVNIANFYRAASSWNNSGGCSWLVKIGAFRCIFMHY